MSVTRHDREKWLEGAKHPATIAALKRSLDAAPPPGAAPAPAIRVPKPKKIPQTEQEYGAILAAQFRGYRIEHEKLKIVLPGSIVYTPDFAVWQGNRLVLLVEVKGPFKLASASRSHAAFKIALEGYPQITFRFAQKQDSGEWAVRDFNTPTPP